jgi:hypothetical protein
MTALYPRILDHNGTIQATEWARNVTDKAPVGGCACGGYLFPTPPMPAGKVVWYTARCGTCTHEVTAPNGHTVPKTATRSRMPAGAWDARCTALKRQAAGVG